MKVDLHGRVGRLFTASDLADAPIAGLALTAGSAHADSATDSVVEAFQDLCVHPHQGCTHSQHFDGGKVSGTMLILNHATESDTHGRSFLNVRGHDPVMKTRASAVGWQILSQVAWIAREIGYRSLGAG